MPSRVVTARYSERGTALPLVGVLDSVCLISAFVTFGLGVLVISGNPQSGTNRLFGILMFLVTYWALGEYFFWIAQDIFTAGLWLRASSCWPFVIACAAHFVLVFTHHDFGTGKYDRLYLAALYIPALLISLSGLLTGGVYTVVPRDDLQGFLYYPDLSGPWYLIQTVYILCVMIWAVWACLVFYFHSARPKLKRHALFISGGVSMVIIAGLFSAVILPVSGIYTPNLVFSGLIIFSFLMTWSIMKDDLFTLKPESVVFEIIRTLPDGLIVADMEGNVSTFNPAAERIFALPQKMTRAGTLQSLLPAATYTLLIEKIGREGVLSDFETETPDGLMRTLSLSGTRVTDPDGYPAGIVLVIRDITGRKEAERALSAANTKISLLTRLTRHDIANQVQALSGYLSLAQEDPASTDGKEALIKGLSVIDRIEKTLVLSRDYQEIGAGKLVWHRLIQVLSRAAADLTNPSIPVVVHTRDLEVHADLLFGKVLYNLLENAERHGGELTAVTVTTREAGDGDLVLVIEDDGSGIRTSDKDLIFSYGYGKHTGLGLALSRDILAVNGTRIRETGEEGKGARFEIIVPAGEWRQYLPDNGEMIPS